MCKSLTTTAAAAAAAAAAGLCIDAVICARCSHCTDSMDSTSIFQTYFAQ